MSDTSTLLLTLRPKLVAHATKQLARAAAVRSNAVGSIANFYELLQSAVDSGTPEWLNPCLDEWVGSRSGSTLKEPQTFLPVLRALKIATWDVLRESCSAAEALEGIGELEPIFDQAGLYLMGIEAKATLEQTATALRDVQNNFNQLNKSKAGFISVAAHELKTPLTLIEGYASIFVEGLPPEQKEEANYLLAGIEKGIQRLKEIIENMLDISLIDNNLLKISYQPARLSQLVEQAYTKVKPAADQRHIELVIENIEDASLFIYLDPVRVFQVLVNLLQNGIKFTTDGGKVTLRARAMAGFIEVTVADTGIGVATENQERIFHTFGSLGDVAFHSTSKTKFKGGGLGLGLPISRGIVEAHGGTLWVESAGHDEQKYPGSIFHLMLPIRQEPPAADGE
ncbi:MAG: HAMP domain-containing histidine kinase [Chloroflexi bacterium]|nr:HAMP domain-containing histidine kinase [Chloroflexota bacterium]